MNLKFSGYMKSINYMIVVKKAEFNPLSSKSIHKPTTKLVTKISDGYDGLSLSHGQMCFDTDIKTSVMS